MFECQQFNVSIGDWVNTSILCLEQDQKLSICFTTLNLFKGVNDTDFPIVNLVNDNYRSTCKSVSLLEMTLKILFLGGDLDH